MTVDIRPGRSSTATFLAEHWVSVGGEDLDAMIETLEILGDPEAMAEIRASEDADARGDVIRGRDAARALRPRL
jgi:antitoxin YefM